MTVFPISQNLLYNHSGYFIRAFGGTGTYLRESQTRLVELDDEDADSSASSRSGYIPRTSSTQATSRRSEEMRSALQRPYVHQHLQTRRLPCDARASEHDHDTPLPGLQTAGTGQHPRTRTLIQPCYERTLPDTPLSKWISHLYALLGSESGRREQEWPSMGGEIFPRIILDEKHLPQLRFCSSNDNWSEQEAGADLLPTIGIPCSATGEEVEGLNIR